MTFLAIKFGGKNLNEMLIASLQYFQICLLSLYSYLMNLMKNMFILFITRRWKTEHMLFPELFLLLFFWAMCYPNHNSVLWRIKSKPQQTTSYLDKSSATFCKPESCFGTFKMHWRCKQRAAVYSEECLEFQLPVTLPEKRPEKFNSAFWM